LQNVDQLEQPAQQKPHEGDELARMAGLLLQNVKDELNPKFQKSQFMGLMKQLRDGNVIVEGNQMVENHGQSKANGTAPQVDVKGKGRATDSSLHMGPYRSTPFRSQTGFMDSVSNEHFVIPQTESSDQQLEIVEDANDAYFRQENEEYKRYWNGEDASINSKAHTANPDVMSWDQLQNDWDKFEATASGIKPLDNYQFQNNNPYLIGDSSSTRHHLMHSHQSILEVRPCQSFL
jgi:peroxin-5